MMEDMTDLGDKLHESIRKIVREEIQKMRPIEIVGLNSISAEDFIQKLQVELSEKAKQESKFKRRQGKN